MHIHMFKISQRYLKQKYCYDIYVLPGRSKSFYSVLSKRMALVPNGLGAVKQNVHHILTTIYLGYFSGDGELLACGGWGCGVGGGGGGGGGGWWWWWWWDGYDHLHSRFTLSLWSADHYRDIRVKLTTNNSCVTITITLTKSIHIRDLAPLMSWKYIKILHSVMNVVNQKFFVMVVQKYMFKLSKCVNEICHEYVLQCKNCRTIIYLKRKSKSEQWMHWIPH